MDLDFSAKIRIEPVSPRENRFFDLSSLKYRRATPEEYVRAGLVTALHVYYGFPHLHITTEEPLWRDELFTYRADIVVWADATKSRPYMLIEVKAPDVGLTSDMVDKLLDAAECLPHGVRPDLLVLTNRDKSLVIRHHDGVSLGGIPNCRLATRGFSSLKPIESAVPFVRPLPSPFELRENSLRKRVARYDALSISDSRIPRDAERAYVAFYEMLLDENIDLAHESPAHLGYQLVEDRGVRWSSFTNASGGRFHGLYRHLLIRTREGRERNFCLSVSPYCRQRDEPASAIAIIGGIDGNQALQLQSDVPGSDFSSARAVLRHRGHIALGEGGRIAREKVVEHLRKNAPDLIDDGRIMACELDTAALDGGRSSATVLRLAILSDMLDQIRSQVREERRLQRGIELQ